MDLSEKLISVLRYIDFVTALVELVRKFATSLPGNTAKEWEGPITTLLYSASNHLDEISSMKFGPEQRLSLVLAKANLERLITESSTQA